MSLYSPGPIPIADGPKTVYCDDPKYGVPPCGALGTPESCNLIVESYKTPTRNNCSGYRAMVVRVQIGDHQHAWWHESTEPDHWLALGVLNQILVSGDRAALHAARAFFTSAPVDMHSEITVLCRTLSDGLGRGRLIYELCRRAATAFGHQFARRLSTIEEDQQELQAKYECAEATGRPLTSNGWWND